MLASCPTYGSDAEVTHFAPLITADVFKCEHMQVQSVALQNAHAPLGQEWHVPRQMFVSD